MPQDSPGNNPNVEGSPAPGSGTARISVGPTGSPQQASAAPPVEDAAKPKGPTAPGGDFLGKLPPKPSGTQKEEAEFAKDGGSVPAGFVPSGGGPVPLGSLPAAEQERALQLRRQDGRRPDDKELGEKDLEGMSAPDLKALGVSRGYKMPDAGGRKAMQRAFLRFQEEAPTFGGQDKNKKE